MGVIFAKFRKNKTITEILEKLENEIKGIEEYSISTQEKQKRYVGNILVLSIGFYVIGFCIFYFLFFPPHWSKRILYSLPLLIFPILIWFLKRFVAWYFQRKLNKNSNKLNLLRAEKKKILENVKNKETYNVASEILKRFDPTRQIQTPSPLNRQAITPKLPINSISTPSTYNNNNRQIQLHNQRQLSAITPKTLPKQNQSYLTPNQRIVGTHNTTTTSSYHVSSSQQEHTPFPIINQNAKSIVEKMVDFLIGDGPSSRYGMICKECYGHNGMVSFEDYQYTAFRCAFCKALNPARKLRPVGPKLPSDSGAESSTPRPLSGRDMSSSSSTSTSERESASDSESNDEIAIKQLTSEIEPQIIEAVEIVKKEEQPIESTTTDEKLPLNTENKDDNKESIVETTVEKSKDEKKND